MAFQVSPGVSVTEKDLTNVVPAVSTSSGGIVITAEKGPVDEITTISSEKELLDTFGKPTADNFEEWFSAANFLGYGNNLKVVRPVTGMVNAAVSGTAVLTARIALFAWFSGFQAPTQSVVRSSILVYGKIQIAGIPRSAASRAASTTLSTERRITPGIDGIGSSIFSPLRTNTGHIKSLTVITFSLTIFRIEGDCRTRRRRVAGKEAWVGRIIICPFLSTIKGCHGFSCLPRVGFF